MQLPSSSYIGELSRNERVAALVLAIISAWLSYTLAYNLYISPLAKFPGPKLWAISRIPNQISILKGRNHLDVTLLFRKYGPVVRIAPNELAFCSAQAYRDIYGSRPGHEPFLKDGRLYQPTVGGTDHIASTKSVEVHARQRKLLSLAFSERAIREQEGMIASYADLLVKRLQEQCEKSPASQGAVVDLVMWFTYTTFDITGMLTYGESFHCLESNELHPWIRFLFSSVRAGMILFVIHQYQWFAQVFRRMLPRKAMQAAQDHYDLAARRADKRLDEGQSDRPDLIGLLMRNGFSRSSHGLGDGESGISLGELHSNAWLLVLAGSETTATHLSGVIFYLCRHPEALKKLAKEVRSAFTSSSDITFQAASHLTYLHAVMQETFRVYPSVVPGHPRIVPSKGDTVDGHFIPGKTVVGCHQYAGFRDASNFSSPDDFIPERWVDTKGEFSSDKRDALQPFSLGPWNCLGQSLAYAEIRLVLSKFIWHFDVELCPEAEHWDDQRSFFVWEKTPLMAKLRKRT